MNYTGPKVRLSRRVGIALTPKAAKVMRRKKGGPGEAAAQLLQESPEQAREYRRHSDSDAGDPARCLRAACRAGRNHLLRPAVRQPRTFPGQGRQGQGGQLQLGRSSRVSSGVQRRAQSPAGQSSQEGGDTGRVRSGSSHRILLPLIQPKRVRAPLLFFPG